MSTDRPSEPADVPPASVRLRRLARHWGVVFVVAIVFLMLGMCVREKPRVVPASLGSSSGTPMSVSR